MLFRSTCIGTFGITIIPSMGITSIGNVPSTPMGSIKTTEEVPRGATEEVTRAEAGALWRRAGQRYQHRGGGQAKSLCTEEVARPQRKLNGASEAVRQS